MTDYVTITEEQQDIYRDNKGLVCPFCDSKNVDTDGDFNYTEHGITMDAYCISCNMQWTEIFTLSSIENAFLRSV